MMPIEPDHYAVLELKPGSPMEEVKSQYRRLAKRDHPDLHGNSVRSQEQFRRVNAAYAFLSDAPRKAAYDACLEAARKMVAPAPKPPPAASRASTTATGYHAQPPADVRMTRSAWLGATAGAILVLLVIGLSLDGSGPSRPVGVDSASPAAVGSASGGALGNESGPGVAADPSASSLSAPFTDSAAGASSPPAHRLSRSVPPLPAPVHAGMVGRAPLFPVSNPWTPRAEEANPADAVRNLLLARLHAVLPRTDRLISRGYDARAASADAEDGSRRILRDQLAADLADLSATRARLRPAIARLSRQDTPEELQQETGPIQTDLRRLEEARQPVRDDLKALATVSGAGRTSSAAFRFRQPAPAQAASVAPSPSLPAAPAPAVAPAVPEAPKPPDKPALKPAANPSAKPKTPASAGQEFIMWGK